MCGIAGMLVRHGRADAETLAGLGARLAHRGPDDYGVHLDGPVGLLQTRLAIIHLKSGHQPMVDDGFALVADGHVYNVVDIRVSVSACLRARRPTTRRARASASTDPGVRSRSSRPGQRWTKRPTSPSRCSARSSASISEAMSPTDSSCRPASTRRWSWR